MTAICSSAIPVEQRRIRDYEYVARNGGYKLIFGLAYHMLGNAQEAEDATQETFVRAWRHLDTFDCTHPILHWMSSIARNHIKDRYRRSRRNPTTSLDALSQVGFNPPETDKCFDPEAAALSGEVTHRIRAAVALLPKHFNVPLTLHLLLGRSYTEIAQSLNCPLGTVRSRLHRGRALLRESLRDLFPAAATNSLEPLSAIRNRTPHRSSVR